MELTYKQKREVAEWIAMHNSGAVTGSIMLRERGIELGREPQDIDIIVSTFVACYQDLILPPLVEGLVYEDDKRGYAVLARCYLFGTKIEFLVDDHALNNSMPLGDFYGIEYAAIEDLLKAKKKYIEDDSNADYIEKSKKDIEIIEKFIAEHPQKSKKEFVEELEKELEKPFEILSNS